MGPNGSGKSNVVDALRWCLGEQSMRDLRGQRAEDVIYAGPRRTVGAAEVVMTFEADPSDVHLAWSELALARRLYRSGESEYLVNGRRGRLRDVLAAMHDIGIDANRHVVVTQGMADALLAASPRERRALLEQAAGLSAYRDRRDDANQKLATTRRNIGTIEVVLAEMEPRVRLLRRQARAVSERDEAAVRLRTQLEIWYTARWLETEAHVGEARSMVAEMTRERAAALDAVQQLEEEAELATLREHEWRQRLDVVVAAQHTAERERDTLLHHIERLEQRQSYLQRQEEERTHRIEQFRARYSEAVERVREVEEHITTLAREREELQSAADQRTAALAETRRRADEAAQRLQVQRQDRDRAEANQARIARQLSETRQALAAATGERDRLRQWMIQHERDIARNEAELKAAAEEAEAAAKGHRQVSGGLSEAEGRWEAVRGRSDRLETLRTRIRALCGDTARQLQRQERSLASLPSIENTFVAGLRARDGWEQAVAAALGEWARAANRPDSAISLRRDSTDELHAWRLDLVRTSGRQLLWADEVVKGAPISLMHPLLTTVLAPSDEEAVALWNLLAPLSAGKVRFPGIRVASRLGRVWTAEGVRHVLEDDPAARYLTLTHQVTRLKRRNLVLQARLQAVSEAGERALEERDRLGSTAQDLRATSRRLQDRLAEAHARAERLQHRQTGLRTEREERVAALAPVTEAAAEAERRLAELQSRFDESAAGLRGVVAAWHRVQQELNEARQALAAATEDRDAIRKQVEGVTLREAAQQEVLAAAQRDAQRWKTEIERIHAERPADEELQRLATELRQRRDDVIQLDQSYERRRQEVEAARAAAPKRSDRTVQLRQARAALNTVVGRHERALAGLQQRETLRDQLRAEIVQELGREVETLPPSVDGFSVPNDDEIRRLRARATQYADVDESVVQEFKELDERYRQLQAHVADLQAAARDLEEIIAVADREMKARFRSAFEAVGKEFARVFRIMLRGGEAELQQVDDEGGIDVRAQLPGKRARASAAFSGGERSLIASALLFGVLRIRPTPFCVLDEVDAALDESNVDRYLDVLRDISGNTQMIVVTHNRATMAAADVLYGLTMNDEGMSSTLSLRLDSYDRAG